MTNIWRKNVLELYHLGLSNLDLKNIIETNPNILSMSDLEIEENLSILKQRNCSKKIIKNIIISNPFYLTRQKEDIKELLNTLEKIKISNLPLLLDANPDILNKDAFEIEDFITQKSKKYSLKEIAELIENNPYLMDEEETK